MREQTSPDSSYRGFSFSITRFYFKGIYHYVSLKFVSFPLQTVSASDFHHRNIFLYDPRASLTRKRGNSTIKELSIIRVIDGSLKV